ncbi:MAG: transporter [Thermocrispum sp.]
MDRVLLTLLVLAVFLLGVWAMWRGWRRKAREQSARFAPFPEVPDDLGPELAKAEGLYVATTPHGRWQERIVTRGTGMRGPATLRRHERGVVVDRHGAKGFFIPADAITGVATGRKMAGKVMGTDGLLVITWRLGEQQLDTGFRGDDLNVYPDWIKIGGAA